ncbi:RNA polymerase sigma factor (sigma-70 family) [Ereboglobus sp. PH5-10]|uniref:RNA polymerase sigma factor n=1 Tax=Ereboglobus sp. PH5-10 TaxID=2940629 RepID=UPI002406F7E3|nr:sigma-70 family RNA polymerase sigma factor [Ereboglobus sp. PH5-10]MDF9827478.1 RNA polymerase sigma factor (sigma-70 family) [Ereboglobus sp. PH5-10]
MPTDAELLCAYAGKHSEAAFTELVERRVGFVYNAALRQLAGDAHMAHDVTQIVFSLVARKAAALARHECLSGWLYTTTTHVARRALRDARNRQKREQEAVIMSEIQKSEPTMPEAEFAKLRPLLDDALGALRDGEREAVLLRFFDKCSFGEIGAKLKMSEDAARMRVTRAVEKMRTVFAKRGVTSSAVAVGMLMTAEAAASAPAGLAATVSAGSLVSAGGTLAAIAGAGGIMAFMGSTKITMAALAALCIAAGMTFYGTQQERAAEARLMQAKDENSKLTGQLAAAERKANIQRQRTTSGGRAPMGRSAEETEAARLAGEKLLAEHPEIRDKLKMLGVSSSFIKAHRVADELELSAEQRAALIDACATNWSMSMRDVPGYGAVTLGGRKPGDSGHSRKEQDDRIRDLLGDDGFEKYKAAEERHSKYARYSRTMASALYFTETPLAAEQARALERVCADLREAQGGPVDKAVWWDALEARSQAFLSETQMITLRKMKERLQSNYEGQLRQEEQSKRRKNRIK